MQSGDVAASLRANDLPSEIIQLICSFLQSSEHVRAARRISRCWRAAKLPALVVTDRKVQMAPNFANVIRIVRKVRVTQRLEDKSMKSLIDALKTGPPALRAIEVIRVKLGFKDIASIEDSIRLGGRVTCFTLFNCGLAEKRCFRTLVDGLAKNPVLTSLSLENNQIGLDGATVLAEYLCSNSKLKFLCLASNPLGPEGVNTICKALESNGSLLGLDLTATAIEEGQCGTSIAAVLASGSSALKSLSLEGNCINSSDMSKIAESLRTNTGLTSLNVGQNLSGGWIVTLRLVDALKVNKTLAKLNLQSSRLMPDSAEALATVLSSLRSLCLFDNDGLSDQGTEAIVEALKHNTSLWELSLGKCALGDEGARALADMLRTNTHLIWLDISHNPVGSAGLSAFCDTLCETKTLMTLKVPSKESMAALEKATPRVTTLVLPD